MPSKKPPPAATRTPRKAPPAAPRPDEPPLLHPVRWMKGLLNRKLRVERRGLHIHLLFEPVQAVPETGATESRNGETLRIAHAELRELLDRHGDTRHVLPHLSFVEQALAKSGSRAIDRVPLPVLEKALSQLENLIHDAPGDGLAELRRRLLASITIRSDKGPAAQAAAQPSDFRSEGRLEVSEASHSLFDEMERSWSGQVPVEQASAAR